jgi:hypothetical protein
MLLGGICSTFSSKQMLPAKLSRSASQTCAQTALRIAMQTPADGTQVGRQGRLQAISCCSSLAACIQVTRQQAGDSDKM